MKSMIALTMTTMCLAAPLQAQSTEATPKPPTMPMKKRTPPSDETMAMMMSGRMKPKTNVASISLSLRESLDLTADQVAKLTALQSASHTAMMRHMTAHAQGLQAAATIGESSAPEFSAYESALRAGADHLVLAHLATARADVEARALLSPMQRDRLALARRVMKEMHAGMTIEMRAGMMNAASGKAAAIPPQQ